MARRVISAAGAVSRQLLGRGVLGKRSAGGVRLLARRVAGAGHFRYRDYHGHVMEADLADYIERIGFFGAHSPELHRFVAAYLQRGDWAIDVGANVGLFTSAMAAAVGPTGAVWAFEPLPRNVERLRLLKDRNGLQQLEIFPIALAAASSTAPLRLPASAGGSAFGSFVATWPAAGTIDVETKALDELVAAAGAGPPPSKTLRLVKLDVEGFEAEVLAGAGGTLARWQPLVLCEVHDPLLVEAGSSAEALVDAFAAHGYQPRAPFPRPPGSLRGIVTDILFAPA